METSWKHPGRTTPNGNKPGYLDSLGKWMRSQVGAHKDVKWKIASFHKNMFTGSRSHQDDADGKAVRAAMLPLFAELGINMAFQGHDHIYEVIGPVNNTTKTLASNGVEEVLTVGEPGARENMTGREGGVFNTAAGTLYFLNNSAGKKKYEPRTEEEMIASYSKHEIENYWGLFSGKFGQTGEPTFSRVDVTPESFTVSTKQGAIFIATFLHTRSFNILRRLGRMVKRKTSENQ